VKIVNMEQFLALPKGTLYQKFRPDVVDGDLAMKSDNCNDNDWFYISLTGLIIACVGSGQMHDRLDDMRKHGASYPMEFGISRDGCFEADQLFLVWEPEEVRRLATFITSQGRDLDPGVR
jgi:hypothetical protein